jgi:hypothetical protein
MKKLITLFGALLLGLTNITTIKAENISFDDATFINYYSNHFGYEMGANLSEFGNALITWSIPNFNDLIYASGGIDSAIIFYSKSNQTGFIEEVTVFDLEPVGPYPANLSGTYQFNLLDYGFTQSQIESIRSIKVRIMVSHFVPPSGFGPALADNMIVTTGLLSKATFVHEGNLWFETLYVGTIDEPATNPATVNGFPFEAWYDLDGNVLNEFRTYQGDQVFTSRPINLISVQFYSKNQLISFQNVNLNQATLLTIPNDPTSVGQEFLWWELPDGSILNPQSLYTFNETTRINAVFRNAPQTITTPGLNAPPLNGLLTLLSGFGLNNQLGYLILMLIVFLPLNLFFAWLKFPVIGIAIANLILIALFIYLQFIPFWFSFIIVALIILSIIAMAKGVIRLE